MKKILYGIVIISTIVWLISLIVTGHPNWHIWAIRKELILLTGIMAFSYMALIMLLSIRPKWLESTFGGLDKMYALHKWAGILAISIGGVHYLLKLSGKLLILFFERPARGGGHGGSFLGQYRRLAEDLGEWTMWFLLVTLVLTLWHRFSYHIWRYTHKLMPIVFLILVFHAIVLSPTSYWLQPAGLIIGLCCLVGSVSAVLALFGLIGRKHTYQGTVTAIDILNTHIVEITCRVQGNWQHTAGQYVFFLHNKLEGQHPFTIVSANQGNHEVRLCIKALGDYTRKLQKAIHVGDVISLEGPYGCFDFKKSAIKKQIWIGGGIGITPFLAWLESLQNDPDKDQYIVDLYYCVQNQQQAIFAERLQQLTANLPNIMLYLYYSEQQGYLTIDQLDLAKDHQDQHPTIWFCGPSGFAESLKNHLTKKKFPANLFHRELFEMR